MSTALMASRKKKQADPNMAIAKMIIEQYKPTTVKEMQDSLKAVFGPMFEAMLKGELDAHLGCESNDHGEKESDNRRNGYGTKVLKSSMGDVIVNSSMIYA